MNVTIYIHHFHPYKQSFMRCVLMENGHSVTLHLAPELRSALIKYMGANDQDKQYAALTLLLKSMRSENLITQEVYEFYRSRYGKTISSHPSNMNQTPKLFSKEMLQEKQKIDEKARYFSMILDQWHIHGVDWRQKKVVEAEQWKDQVQNAKLVIDLGATQK